MEGGASILKCGWLTKQGGHGMKLNWRKRWFVIDKQYLRYFKFPSVIVHW